MDGASTAAPADQRPVFVETAGRLHFGVLDLRGTLGRWFGGIGAATPSLTLRLSATRARALTVAGEDAARAEMFARRFLDFHRIAGGAHVVVHRALPAHAGLGSGTQLALAVARSLAELHGVDPAPPLLARAVGRARRSAVGTWTFAHGGLVVEGGRRRDADTCGPLVAQLAFPPSWRCVVVVPRADPGISGAAEAAAFETLPLPPESDVARVSYLTLMALLPAAADADLPTFGAALTEIQEITGRWFAPVQGGVFAHATHDLVESMTALGAAGVGQSSWGPTVYAVVDGDEQAATLAGEVRRRLGSGGAVYAGAFPVHGARVWRESPDAAP